MSKQRTDVKVRLSADEFEALRDAAYQRRVTYQEALAQGLALWLGGSRHDEEDDALRGLKNQYGSSTKHKQRDDKSNKEDYNSGTAENSGWLELLEGILHSGHVLAIEAITRNLMAFDALIHEQTKAGRNEHYSVPDHDHLTRELTRLLAEKVRRDEEREGIIRPAKAG